MVVVEQGTSGEAMALYELLSSCGCVSNYEDGAQGIQRKSEAGLQCGFQTTLDKGGGRAVADDDVLSAAPNSASCTACR